MVETIVSRVRVERISPANENAILRYLARSPYDNVHLSYLVRYDRSTSTRSGIFAAFDDGDVVGAASFGRQLVLASEPMALTAFAALADRRRGERMIVGPRSAVQGLWHLLRARRPPPRLVRERQLVMKLDANRLAPGPRDVTVRLANPSDWTAIVDSSAQMIEHELAYDPRRSSPDFAAGVRAMIERQRWWVGEQKGRLCFFCSIGPWCERTTQLQGIWTPPAMRGKGLATAALGAICELLLQSAPTLSLYVNDFNERAIALYHRIGFEHVSDFQTILF